MEETQMDEKTVQTIQTILIVRNDGTSNWEKSDYCLLKGELGIGYLENGNVIVKSGVDGNTKWASCPQVEGVLEKDLILTYNFGRHTTSNGFVDAKGKGMTVSQWIEDALSVTKAPTITYPSASMSAAFKYGSTEAGDYVTAVTWDGGFSSGSYQYGTNTNGSANTTTGATVSWKVKDASGNEIGTAQDNATGWAYSAQIADTAITYTLSSEATINLPAEGTYVPKNNVGALVASSRITGFDKDGTQKKTFSPQASVTGYRKPFWGILTTPYDVDALTSAQVRGLANSGTSTAGVPTTLSVPAGSRQVLILAKAGTKSKLVANDSLAMNAEVSFDKKANAVAVEGKNGYTAVNYDLWSVTWDGPIASDKSLTLTWS
jgi:hypothetical protein